MADHLWINQAEAVNFFTPTKGNLVGELSTFKGLERNMEDKIIVQSPTTLNWETFKRAKDLDEYSEDGCLISAAWLSLSGKIKLILFNT